MKIEFNEENEYLIDVIIGRSLLYQINTEDIESFIEEEQLNYEVHGNTSYNWTNGYIEDEESWLVKNESASSYLESNLYEVVKMYIKHKL